MSHSVYVYIASLESLETIAGALSSLTGHPLRPTSNGFVSDDVPFPGTEETDDDGDTVGCWLAITEVDESWSTDENMLLMQYQFQIRIDGGARADQTSAGCAIFRALRRTERYRVILLTNDGQIENDVYQPGPIETWGMWDYDLRGLWKERGASAALEEPQDIDSHDREGVRELAWRLFRDELEALGAPTGREAEWAGAWHLGANGTFYRTDQQAQALALFTAGWSHARFAGQFPGHPPADEPRPERRMSAVVSRQLCIAQINEPGVTGTRGAYLRAHRDGRYSIPGRHQEVTLHFDDYAQANAWLVDHGYTHRRHPEQKVSGR